MKWPSLALCLVFTGNAIVRADERVDYLKDVKPILRDKCFACHGALEQKARLRLDTAALAKKGGQSGPALRPGDAAHSLLIQRVTEKEESDRMPPEGPPLTAAQIAKLKDWIAQGAAGPTTEEPERDPRDHWAFRAPARPDVPRVKDAVRAKNPIDAFIAAGHEKRGLAPAPPADSSVLLRRVTLDLIGLPPTREELRAFLEDPAPDAYEKVVDRLLADPRHGERWGRHWMDVWRYSDWHGRRMVPDVWNSAPQVWRWRDWIVRSLNADKGYDRMIQEMLAADEIAPGDDEAAVATGYLVRNWYALNPNDWMRSNVEHAGKAFLGLTFNCAHCHDHKYDPIRQEDYFRFRAFFEPIGVRQDRVPGEADPGPFQEYQYSTLRKIVRLGVVRVFDKDPTATTWFYTDGDERNRLKDRGSISPGLPAVFGRLPEVRPIELPPRAYYPGLRPAIHETILKDQRATLARAQVELDAQKPKTGPVNPALLKVTVARVVALQAELTSIEARIAADRAKYGETAGADVAQLSLAAATAEREAAVKSAEAALLAQESALAAAEARPASDANRAKEIAAATKTLGVAKTALDKTRETARAGAATYSSFGPVYPKTSTGRRRALAEWIGSRSNPLTARVAINHIWLRHFHAPLVASVFDFGRNGSRPTHPELLDWLACELMAGGEREAPGWGMKRIHRLIVTSQTYRMASAASAPDNVARDPENKYLWRMNTGRMESEVVRDSLLYCAGELDRTMGGQELENGQALTTRRRSLYYSCHPETDGKSELGMLFDAPDGAECYRRTRTVIPQQALALTNSDLVHDLSAKLAKALWEGLPADQRNPTAFVTAAYEALLSRRPKLAEQEACADFLKGGEPRAREGLVRVLLNHNDFVTIR